MTTTMTNTRTAALCLAALLALPHVAYCRPAHSHSVASPAEQPALRVSASRLNIHHGLQAAAGSTCFSAVDHQTQGMWLADSGTPKLARTVKMTRKAPKLARTAKLTRTVEPKNECIVRRTSLA